MRGNLLFFVANVFLLFGSVAIAFGFADCRGFFVFAATRTGRAELAGSAISSPNRAATSPSSSTFPARGAVFVNATRLGQRYATRAPCSANRDHYV